MKLCTSWAPKFVTFRLVSAISPNETRRLRDILRSLRVIRGINRGYYIAAQRHKISLRVLKNISRVSAPFELFYDEFKVTICCKKTFCLCWVGKLLRWKIAFMRCVTFSNVLYFFGLFKMENEKFWPPLKFCMQLDIAGGCLQKSYTSP